jgi:hypothetical protein
LNPAKNAFNPEKHKIFVPKYPKKYVGSYPIVLKSSWEVSFARWCDSNINVLQWGSEDIGIPYYDTTRKTTRRYFPDFIIKLIDKDKKTATWVVEIKPYKEVVGPSNKKSGKTMKSKMYESITYINNVSKWKAAEDFCRKRGFKFRIITERELYK